jgi:hypothetical protein
MNLARWKLSGNDEAWPDSYPSPFPQDRPPRRVDGAALRVSFAGHASFLIQGAGLNILTDPVWSERARPFSFHRTPARQPARHRFRRPAADRRRAGVARPLRPSRRRDLGTPLAARPAADRRAAGQRRHARRDHRGHHRRLGRSGAARQWRRGRAGAGVSLDGTRRVRPQIADRAQAVLDVVERGGRRASNRLPASLRATLRVVRVRSRIPSRVSSRRRAWLSADWEMPSRAAARVKFRSAATAAKAWRSLRSSRCIHAQLQCAAEARSCQTAWVRHQRYPRSKAFMGEGAYPQNSSMNSVHNYMRPAVANAGGCEALLSFCSTREV